MPPGAGAPLIDAARPFGHCRGAMHDAKPARPPSLKPALDRIDRAILRALRGRGRITYQALAERVGLTPRPCLERVRRLEARGVIRGYTALVDPISLGHHVSAIAEIAMRDPSAAARQRLERALVAHPAVVEVQVVSGEYDYAARIVSGSLAEYEALTDAFLTDPAFGVARVHSTFILRTLKSFDGFPVDEG